MKLLFCLPAAALAIAMSAGAATPPALPPPFPPLARFDFEATVTLELAAQDTPENRKALAEAEARLSAPGARSQNDQAMAVLTYAGKYCLVHGESRSSWAHLIHAPEGFRMDVRELKSTQEETVSRIGLFKQAGGVLPSKTRQIHQRGPELCFTSNENLDTTTPELSRLQIYPALSSKVTLQKAHSLVYNLLDLCSHHTKLPDFSTLREDEGGWIGTVDSGSNIHTYHFDRDGRLAQFDNEFDFSGKKIASVSSFSDYDTSTGLPRRVEMTELADGAMQARTTFEIGRWHLLASVDPATYTRPVYADQWRVIDHRFDPPLHYQVRDNRLPNEDELFELRTKSERKREALATYRQKVKDQQAAAKTASLKPQGPVTPRPSRLWMYFPQVKQALLIGAGAGIVLFGFIFLRRHWKE